MPRYVAQRRTFCKTLYENYLGRDKWKHIVTLDEARVYLYGYYKKGIFTVKNEEKKSAVFVPSMMQRKFL